MKQEKPEMDRCQSIILGALLHDIGKFTQRAGEKLDEKGREDAEKFCPKDEKGYPTHLHVIHGERYVEKLLKGTEWVEASNFVLRHHAPDRYGDKIVQLADWLSGGERRDRKTGEVGEFRKEPLISIFSQVEVDNEKINPCYCPLEALSSDVSKISPVPTKEKALLGTGTSSDRFNYLWRNFLDETKLINKDDFEILFSQLLYLLEKYTLFIPSSAYKDEPEISLYHHLKSTAAIASCLWDLKLDEKKIERIIRNFPNGKEESLYEKDFIFLGGDISGIQDFIYSVTTEHALKGLRGRSFYLQILSEIVAKSILSEFDLTPANLIFSGGGHFILLLPNTNFTERINELTREINSVVFKAHNGKLGVVIAWTPFSYNDFYIKNFGKVLQRLKESLAREKRRKFKEIIDPQKFRPFGEGGELKACPVCGRETQTDDKCELCRSFEELSQKIKNAEYIEIEKVDKKTLTREINSWKELLEAFGYRYWFVRKDDEKIQRSKNLSYSLNNTDFLSKNFSGYRFEATYSPEGTLEDIAEEAEGTKKWGALRMDVDNLGKIFSTGLRNQTISRFSMLSYMFSLFFQAGIRGIVEEKYKEKACIVYSGGDDLFILGSWSILPEIAKEIYNRFRGFTAHHPRITLSAGIYIAPSQKFPVYQSAKEAGSLEEKAKSGDKNKITLLNKIVTWDILDDISKIKDKIKELLTGGNNGQQKKKMPRSLLALLYSAISDREKYEISRIWLLLYGLRRLVERYITGSDEQMKLAMELRDEFVKNNQLKDNLDLAVRWAEYLTKEGG